MARMKRIGRWIAIMLVALVALGLLAWQAAPALLDRIYYQGPASPHYDGQRFFNPEGDQGSGGAQRAFGLRRLYNAATGKRGPGWPDNVAVTPTRPPARITGSALRVTWIGHATVLIQTQGLNILTDPVWADKVGPFGLFGPRRVRAPGVRFDDLPKIDAVLVSHDHYDHMDVDLLAKLWKRDRPVIVTSLGNDTILRDHGAPAVARDWGGRVTLRPGIDVIVEQVHHWGSRWGADRNRALWSGFTITLPGGNIFFAGDTGWGDGGWVTRAAKDGPYRLAILPIGAYHPREVFSGNHIDPQQSVRVFETLGATHALGIHWGTFQLTEEAIDEPRTELAKALKAENIAPDRFRTLEAGQAWTIP
jgi:L-ascorbate metabolism protein UlaG (beta-lactamase superfamily)